MRQKLLAGALIAVTAFISACETMTTSRRVAVSANEDWVILPFENLSQTPLAGDRAKSLAETHLRAQGVGNVHVYQPEGEQSLLTLLDESSQVETARQWAKDNGYVYAVTGTVQEWQYKNGLDNEPSVSLTLRFLQLQQDEVMWVASSARTGWGYNNLAGVASKTIAALMEEVRFEEPRTVTRIVKRVPATPEPVQTVAAPTAGEQPPVSTTLIDTPLASPLEPTLGAARPQPADEKQPATTTVTNDDTDPLMSPYQTNLREPTNR